MNRIVLLVLLTPLMVRAEEFSPVQISLRSQGMALTETITVGDVADVSGGSPLLRERIRRIDLGDAPKTKETVGISAAQIEFRLQLTDLPKKSFLVTGAKEMVVVPFVETLSDERVIEAARERLLKSYSWPEEDLSIRLVRPLTVQLPKISGTEKVVIKTELHAPVVDLGRCQVNVAIVIDGEKRLQFPLQFETKLMKVVPVTTQSLTKGERFSEKNVKFEKQPVDGSNKSPEIPSSVIGKIARRPLSAGQIINVIDLETEATATEGAVMIKPRQIIKMLVPLGNVSVVAQGEAMQEGKMGQAIRVQNVDSKKVVVGRVTGPDTVEINPGGVP